MSLPKSVHGIEGWEIFVVLRCRWRSCWTCSLKGDQFPLQRAPKWRATRIQVLVWRASQLQCCSPRGHGLGLEAPRGPEKKSRSWSWPNGLVLVLVLILKSCNFRDLQVQLFLLWNYWTVHYSFFGILSLCDTIWHCPSLKKVNTLKITKWTVVYLLI